MQTRNLVVGLDGFEISIARKLASRGKLPFFSRLFQEAATFHLDHGEARDTGLAWEHFATGQSPDNYKRWSAVTFDPQTYEVLQSPSVQHPFTKGLGQDVIVFDTPYHLLDKGPDCPLGIVDWGAHDPGVPQQSNPESLRTEIEGLFGAYPAKEFIYGFVWPSRQRTEKMAADLLTAAKKRTAIAEWLLTERFPDWQTAIVVTSELHSAVEAMWHGWDAAHPLHGVASAKPARAGLEALYMETDRMLARLHDRFPDARLVTFAMHGMGSNHADVLSMAILPEFMYRLETGKSALSSRAEWQASNGAAMDQNEDWSNAVIGCMDLQREPVNDAASNSWWLRFMRLLQPGADKSSAVASGNLALSWMPSALYAQHWPKMRAFALPSFYDGQIRVNLVGREARGMVSVDDYERELDRIETHLHRLQDPHSGKRVVAHTSRPLSKCPLQATATQCDIKISWASGALAVTHPDTGTIGPLPHRRTGGHTGKSGFAALMNCGLTPGLKGVRTAFDVAPTVACMASENPDLTNFSGRSLLDWK